MKQMCCLLEVKSRAQSADHLCFYDSLRYGFWEAVPQSAFAPRSLQCKTRGAMLGELESDVLSFSFSKCV